MEDVPVAALSEGDLLLVRPGAGVPADGEVRDGHSQVNEAMITGESRPVEKDAGDRVIAGTINGAGSLRVVVTGTGERTAGRHHAPRVRAQRSAAGPRCCGSGRGLAI
jgi:Cu2+-exporting ATPase